MQRALIKSSRSCRRGRERVGIPLSLRQSLSQIKVRFGARENNSVRARAWIPRARPGSRFGIFIRRGGFIVAPRFPPFHCHPDVCVSLEYRILGTHGHVLGIILSKISKDIRQSILSQFQWHAAQCHSLTRYYREIARKIFCLST